MLGLEKLQRLVIGDDMNTSTDQFVFPLEESLKYHDGLMLKGPIVPLSVRELLGQETGRLTSLPLQSLPIHCSSPKD